MSRVSVKVWVMLALALSCVLTPPAKAGLIFSTFGPGETWGPDSVGVGAIPVPGVFLFVGVAFTPAGGSYRLGTLLLPLAVVSGPGDVEVSLMSDSGGAPGAAIESFHVINPAPQTTTTINSVTNPLLSEGTQYWVVVTGGTPSTFAFWGLAPLGDSGLQASRDDGAPWLTGPNRRGAVQLNDVPEPATGLLCGSALLALATLLCSGGPFAPTRRSGRG